MLPEAGPVVAALLALQTTLAHITNYPDTYYSSDEEAMVDYSLPITRLIHRVCVRNRAEVCLLRGPELTPFTPLLFSILTAAGYDTRVICMIRDPRDAVASMRVWQQRRIDAGKQVSIPGANNIAALAQYCWSFYPPILNGLELQAPNALAFVRYEDLVGDPLATAHRAGSFAGLDTSRFDPAMIWQRTAIDYPSRRGANEAITALFQAPVSSSSIGAWRQQLEAGDADAVLQICDALIKRFYPELFRT